VSKDLDLKMMDFLELEKKLLAQILNGQYEKNLSFHEILTPPMMILDEHHEIKNFGNSIFIQGFDEEEKSWKRTEFKSGPETPPSKSKRAKLRAKRKK